MKLAEYKEKNRFFLFLAREIGDKSRESCIFVGENAVFRLVAGKKWR